MGATTEDDIRANTYVLLGALLAAPASEEVLALLRQIEAADASDAEMAVAWKTLRLAGERARQDALQEEYNDLFVGLGRGELVPYGSWYMTGFLMDQPLAVLRRDLAALGFERREQVHEPEDHVAALCETMGLIIRGGNEISLDVQRKFFADHIAPWMERFFADLQQAKSARFYRAVGQLGEQFIRLEKRYLGMLA